VQHVDEQRARGEHLHQRHEATGHSQGRHPDDEQGRGEGEQVTLGVAREGADGGDRDGRDEHPLTQPLRLASGPAQAEQPRDHERRALHVRHGREEQALPPQHPDARQRQRQRERVPTLEAVAPRRRDDGGHDEQHEHRRLDEPEPPVGAEPLLPEHPVEQGHGRPRVLPDEQVRADDDDERRRGDAAHRGEQAAHALGARCLAEPEAGQVPADEHEQGVGRALEPEDVGVGADDEHDGDGSQHDARLDRAGGQGPAQARAQGGRRAVGCRVGRAGCRPAGFGGRLGFQRLEVAQGQQVPVRRQVSEVVLDVQRHLDVGQRVTAEGGEGVLRRDRRQPQHGGVPLAQGPRGGRRLGRGRGCPCRGRQVGQRGVVDLAAAQVGQRVKAEVGGGQHLHAPRRDAGGEGRALGQPGVVARGGARCADESHGIRRGEAPHVVPHRAQGALDVVEVDPVPENLRDARPAAGDLEQPGIRDAAEVTGVQALDGSPQREVGGAVGVAEHDVRPAVDDLAVDDLEGPAGHGHTDRGGVLGGEVGGQVGHPRGRLGLAVHDEQVEAPLAPEGGQLDDALRVHPAAGLRDGAQVREVHRGETDAVEQLEGVWGPRPGWSRRSRVRASRSTRRPPRGR
jgi:hypothetical protein